MKKMIRQLLLKLKNKSCKIYSKEISFDIKLGQKIRIYKNVYLDNNVSIGDFTYISEGCKIYADTELGKFCSIAPNVIIAPGEHNLNLFSTHPIAYDKVWNDKIIENIWENKKTIIKNDVWIGCNSIIKSGVTIGNGAVIGCGAIVTKDVPDYAVVAGNPAKIIKYRDYKENNEPWWNDEIEKIKLRALR